MIIFRDLSMLWSLSHILILFIMLYRPRFSQKKTVLLTIAGMLPLIILNVLGMAILGADQMGRILIFTGRYSGILAALRDKYA